MIEKNWSLYWKYQKIHRGNEVQFGAFSRAYESS